MIHRFMSHILHFGQILHIPITESNPSLQRNIAKINISHQLRLCFEFYKVHSLILFPEKNLHSIAYFDEKKSLNLCFISNARISCS